MKYFDWDDVKNEWLISKRGVSFEFIKECIENGQVIASVANHPPYQHQRVFLILIDDYIYEVPYVEDDEKIFLKTIYRSHEATKKYLKNKYEK
ncbi:MAG TPA: DUF4258 domain-containing protein [Candidatus Paceibacterota bacterium]|nr:DUF4258 domain-containing protein [Candidatus Paceibacterota bacterium]HMO82801.1 DUF4258 domain-containing protein [Candidatus Paceibacterota bacterium]